MFPLAPPRLSMTTCCFRFSVRRCASGLASVSDPPPGGYGTISLIGFDGKAAAPCACAIPGAKVSAAHVSAIVSFTRSSSNFLFNLKVRRTLFQRRVFLQHRFHHLVSRSVRQIVHEQHVTRHFL